MLIEKTAMQGRIVGQEESGVTEIALVAVTDFDWGKAIYYSYLLKGLCNT